MLVYVTCGTRASPPGAMVRCLANVRVVGEVECRMSQGHWVVMAKTQYAIMVSARSVISAARVSVDV